MTTRGWIVVGALAAGCGGDAGSPTGPTAPTSAAGAGFAAIEAPAKTVSVSDFLADVPAHAGRVALTGAVYKVDGANARFLLCDVAERECIGGT